MWAAFIGTLTMCQVWARHWAYSDEQLDIVSDLTELALQLH